MEDVFIVGVDCAVDPRKVGVATGLLRSNRLHLLDVKVCSSDFQPADAVAGAIKGKKGVLLAVDAPLGWPQTFGRGLARHQAGEAVDSEPNDLVRRQTDKFVKKHIGKQPLDVGADRIARTAFAALSLLESIGTEAGRKVELAWSPEALTGTKAIEVYPAATLLAHGIQSTGYKKAENRADRSAIVEALRVRMTVECPDHLLLANADALDSAVCVLAGADFLRGESLKPTDRTVAEKEGWIWVRDPERATDS